MDTVTGSAGIPQEATPAFLARAASRDLQQLNENPESQGWLTAFRKAMKNWQSDNLPQSDPQLRNEAAIIGEAVLPDSIRQKMLTKLAGDTITRRNPTTNEVEYALYRGAGRPEAKKITGDGTDSYSSWTPSLQETKPFGDPHFAWIPESAISAVPYSLGNPQHPDFRGRNQFGTEQEVIVKPGIQGAALPAWPERPWGQSSQDRLQAIEQYLEQNQLGYQSELFPGVGRRRGR